MHHLTRLAAILIVSAVPVHAYAEDWTPFLLCLKHHKQAAEQAEPSLFDGARLVVDVLCVNEATTLANEMVANPSRKNTVAQRGPVDAFSSFLHVVRRETTASLFELRRARLDQPGPDQ